MIVTASESAGFEVKNITANQVGHHEKKDKILRSF